DELPPNVIGDQPLASVLAYFENGRNGLGAGEAQEGEASVVADLARLKPGVALDRIGQIAPPLYRALLQFEAEEAVLGDAGGPGDAGGGAGLFVVGIEEADLIGDRCALARLTGDQFEGAVAGLPGAVGDDEKIGGLVAF